MPDDHSRLVPLLPIPNRTVKRFCADDSAVTSVKVGYCQAMFMKKASVKRRRLFFILSLLFSSPPLSLFFSVVQRGLPLLCVDSLVLFCAVCMPPCFWLPGRGWACAVLFSCLMAMCSGRCCTGVVLYAQGVLWRFMGRFEAPGSAFIL